MNRRALLKVEHQEVLEGDPCGWICAVINAVLYVQWVEDWASSWLKRRGVPTALKPPTACIPVRQRMRRPFTPAVDGQSLASLMPPAHQEDAAPLTRAPRIAEYRLGQDGTHTE